MAEILKKKALHSFHVVDLVANSPLKTSTTEPTKTTVQKFSNVSPTVICCGEFSSTLTLENFYYGTRDNMLVSFRIYVGLFPYICRSLSHTYTNFYYGTNADHTAEILENQLDTIHRDCRADL